MSRNLAEWRPGQPKSIYFTQNLFHILKQFSAEFHARSSRVPPAFQPRSSRFLEVLTVLCDSKHRLGCGWNSWESAGTHGNRLGLVSSFISSLISLDSFHDRQTVISVCLVDVASSNQVQVPGVELETTHLSVCRWILGLLDGTYEFFQEGSVVRRLMRVGNHSNCVHTPSFFHFPDVFRHLALFRGWLGVHRGSSGGGFVLALGCRHDLVYCTK